MHVQEVEEKWPDRKFLPEPLKPCAILRVAGHETQGVQFWPSVVLAMHLCCVFICASPFMHANCTVYGDGDVSALAPEGGGLTWQPSPGVLGRPSCARAGVTKGGWRGTQIQRWARHLDEHENDVHERGQARRQGEWSTGAHSYLGFYDEALFYGVHLSQGKSGNAFAMHFRCTAASTALDQLTGAALYAHRRVWPMHSA